MKLLASDPHRTFWRLELRTVVAVTERLMGIIAL